MNPFIVFLHFDVLIFALHKVFFESFVVFSFWNMIFHISPHKKKLEYSSPPFSNPLYSTI